MNLNKPLSVFLAIQMAVSPVMADMFDYRANVFQALDRLTSWEMDIFNETDKSLRRAYDLSPDSSSRKQIGQAIDQLNAGIKVGQLTSEQNISKTAMILKEAISSKPILLNQSHVKETELVESLIKMALFPSNAEQVEIAFEGVERNYGLWLLASSIVDPQTIKYDNGVKSLITGKDIYGNDSQIRVKYLVEAGELNVANTADIKAETAAVVRGFSDLMPSESGIKAKAKIVDKRSFLYIEFKGYQATELVKNWLLMKAAYLGGNRYIFKTANVLEKVGDILATTNVGGNIHINETLRSAGKAVDMIERQLRSKLAASYFEPSYSSVIEKVKLIAARHLNHMDSNLVSKLENIKAADISAVEKAKKIKELQDTTNAWKSAENLAATQKVSAVEKAIESLKKSPAYLKLSQGDQQRLLLEKAEEVAGLKAHQKLFTFDRFMKIATAVVAVSYVYNGVRQIQKAENTEQKYQAYESMIINVVRVAFLYTPYLREASAFLDLASFAINTGIEKKTGIHLPDTEGLLRYVGNAGEALGYRQAGLTKFKYQVLDLRNRIGRHELFLYENTWQDHALLRLNLKMKECQKDFNNKDCQLEVFLLREEAIQSMALNAKDELTVIYAMTLKTDNEYHAELTRYEEEKMAQILYGRVNAKNSSLNQNAYYPAYLRAIEAAQEMSQSASESVVEGKLNVKPETKKKVQSAYLNSNSRVEN